jgi:hypothetical protein
MLTSVLSSFLDSGTSKTELSIKRTNALAASQVLKII